MAGRSAGSKIAASLAQHGDHFRAAGEELHHLVLGPGAELEGQWKAAGLTLPDLPAMQQYRLDRVREQSRRFGYGGVLLFDPMNIRYATDTTNMQLWVMHNAARYAWVSTDGPVIVWDFFECEFLSGHNPLIDEVRPAIGSTFFLAGPRYRDLAQRWADEMISVITEHAGSGAQIAIDQCQYLGYKLLEDAGFSIESGQEVMELARAIKGPDELAAMRCAVNACQTTMAEMHEVVEPGMTEREVWSMLHAGNIARAGEWIETQILASGPRTNPWMQEASSRVLKEGELLAYDTDLVGAYGMMVDISRTRLVGDGLPNANQREVYELAREQIERNFELLTPGRTFADLSHRSWIPPTDHYRHYCCLFHGVGQCDEYPDIFVPSTWDDIGYEGQLEPGMVLTVEAFVGRRDGGEGVKLEDQVLITEAGPELLSDLTLDLR